MMTEYSPTRYQSLALKVIGLFLAMVLLVGCDHQLFNHPSGHEYTEVHYAKRPDADYQLSLRGIYTLNRETVFLYGGVNDVSDRWWGPHFSVLLRSDDGGKTWNEVMQPVDGSDVMEMALSQDGDGWLLVEWISEGPGPASLYHTTDYGGSWELLSDIPFFGGHSTTVDVQFYSSQHILIKQIDQVRGRGCCSLETLDGGATWLDANECSDESECHPWTFSFPTEMMAEDDSHWKFTVQEDFGYIKVSRRLSSEKPWNMTCTIPLDFTYESQ